MLCVLGHAGPQEGGAQSGLQLAARRAGAVAERLAKLGVERDRIRAEARRAAFARGVVPEERSVTVVLLPASPVPP
jgi:coenzyme F420-reducing hydrogenase delta subunit